LFVQQPAITGTLYPLAKSLLESVYGVYVDGDDAEEAIKLLTEGESAPAV
jgi:hypothetical protein